MGCFALLTGCVCAPATSVEALAAEVDQARQTLLGYFDALNDGHYVQASERYGGSFEVLQGYNPDLKADDYPALFERACTVNGFMCLEILEVVRQEVIQADTFRFVVRFADPDGSLFMGGRTSEQEFAYTVRHVGERFVVADLPVYLP